MKGIVNCRGVRQPGAFVQLYDEDSGDKFYNFAFKLCFSKFGFLLFFFLACSASYFSWSYIENLGSLSQHFRLVKNVIKERSKVVWHFDTHAF